LLTTFSIAADIGFLDLNKITGSRYLHDNEETRSVSDADYHFSRVPQKVESNPYSHPFMHSPFSPFPTRTTPGVSGDLMGLKEKNAFSQDSFSNMQSKRAHSMPYPGYQETYEDSCMIILGFLSLI